MKKLDIMLSFNQIGNFVLKQATFIVRKCRQCNRQQKKNLTIKILISTLKTKISKTTNIFPKKKLRKIKTSNIYSLRFCSVFVILE